MVVVESSQETLVVVGIDKGALFDWIMGCPCHGWCLE
jgi:hypothetical protein